MSQTEQANIEKPVESEHNEITETKMLGTFLNNNTWVTNEYSSIQLLPSTSSST